MLNLSIIIFREICDAGGSKVNPEFISQLAGGYLDICVKQKPEARDLTEFFGLRDFYRFVASYSLLLFIIIYCISIESLVNSYFLFVVFN